MTAQQLKNSILQLAVQGKLVPQDPNDEPASVLLERITKERERLIKEKKIKKPKNTSRIFRLDGHYYESVNGGEPACIDEQIPFDIPESWEWVRLSSYCQYGEAPSIKGTEISSGYWVLDLEDIEAQTGKILKKVVSENRKSTSNKYEFSKDMVLYSKLRPYLNKVVVAPYEGCCTTEIIPICLFSESSPYFLQMLMMSPMFVDSINADSYGVKMPRADTAQVKSFLLPIPPQKEQLRIIARFHALQPYLDSYKERQSALDSLNADFAPNLKKSILQYAIKGKIIPQDPNDEPACVLLARIAKERAKLGKKAAKSMSRIERRDKGTYEIFPDGSEKDISGVIPFDIPDSWAWCRLQNYCLYGEVPCTKVKDCPPDFWVLDLEDIPPHSGLLLQRISAKKRPSTSNKHLFKPGMVLYSKLRPYLNKVIVAEESGCCTTEIIPISLFSETSPYYLKQLLMSPLFVESINADSYGVKMPRADSKKIKEFLIPVPPLKEQHRIIEKLGVLVKEIGATK